ncbi:Krueppel-like factor 3 [Platysternon megacephalum]|uniref:Krueppel-like factor 3 n=1 Tax=Platysternon megacephalum TaxID=55544 RepID=A0A4D9EWS3_9SAUR|nr:Krueppel-like factor 3 [Platysternon megacephalum]
MSKSSPEKEREKCRGAGEGRRVKAKENIHHWDSWGNRAMCSSQSLSPTGGGVNNISTHYFLSPSWGQEDLAQLINCTQKGRGQRLLVGPGLSPCALSQSLQVHLIFGPELQDCSDLRAPFTEAGWSGLTGQESRAPRLSPYTKALEEG